MDLRVLIRVRGSRDLTGLVLALQKIEAEQEVAIDGADLNVRDRLKGSPALEELRAVLLVPSNGSSEPLVEVCPRTEAEALGRTLRV